MTDAAPKHVPMYGFNLAGYKHAAMPTGAVFISFVTACLARGAEARLVVGDGADLPDDPAALRGSQ